MFWNACTAVSFANFAARAAEGAIELAFVELVNVAYRTWKFISSTSTGDVEQMGGLRPCSGCNSLGSSDF